MIKKEYVAVSDVKKYLATGGSKKDICAFMGYSTETTIHKWIVRKSIPKWQQRRLKEFLLSQEINALKGSNG